MPTYVQPNIEENFMERHDPSDWEYLMEYLRENDLESWQMGKNVFTGNLYSPCNMLIAKKTVIEELCSWMFPILDAVVKHGGVKEDVYLNRYPGFVSERLITLFFHKNRNKYNIVYTDKIFLA